MADGFIWGGFNIRKFCKIFFRDFWMVIAIMIIAYLGLSFVDKHTYSPRYTSIAVAAVYPSSSSYRYHTIETVSDLSSKTGDISSVFNSDLFQSGLQNQDPSLKDCIIESFQIANSDLLVLNATSGNPESALMGIRAALDYYSQFSGDVTGASEVKLILGPKDPYPVEGISKIHTYRLHLCVLSGVMMAGLFFFMYFVKKSYKTELCIRRHYKNVRFFSLPLIRSGNKNRILLKKNSQEPIKKVALQIKQVLHKCNKNTLFVTSYTDKEGGSSFLSELAKELAEQKENVLLIETESRQHDSNTEVDVNDDTKRNTLLNVLRQECTVKDSMFYNEELKVNCIQCSLANNDEDFSYSIDEIRRVLSECLGHADIVLVNGAGWYPSHYAQIWYEAVDATIALFRQEDADFFKVDKMLSELQKGNTYFAGCILIGF